MDQWHFQLLIAIGILGASKYTYYIITVTNTGNDEFCNIDFNNQYEVVLGCDGILSLLPLSKMYQC